MAKKYTRAEWEALSAKPAPAVKGKKESSAWTKWVAGGAAVATIWVAAAGTKDSADASPKTETAAATTNVKHTDKEERCLKVGKEFKKQGVAGTDRARFIAIAAYDSTGCQNKDNAGLNKDGSVDDCPLQINRRANADLIKGKDIKKLHDCVEVAIEVKNRQGWNAWSSYQSGSGPYRQEVPMALKLNEELG